MSQPAGSPDYLLVKCSGRLYNEKLIAVQNMASWKCAGISGIGRVKIPTATVPNHEEIIKQGDSRGGQCFY
jgi:hypothetical protein